MKNGSAKTYWLLLLYGLLLGSFFALSAPQPKRALAATGVNQTINFQGRLLNAQGAVVPDGYYNIEFKIYQDGDGQSAGDSTGSPSGSLKWTEDYLNQASHGVKVVNGFLSVQLGSVNPFGSNIDWNQSTLWLSMNVAGTGGSCTPFSSCTPDGEMLPMQPLTSAPYSLNSGELGGLTSSNFVQLAQGVQTDVSTASSLGINKTGASGNIVQLQKGGVDVMVVDNSGTALFRPASDTTTALQVQNRSNGKSVFAVDTTNGQVVLGTAGASGVTGQIKFNYTGQTGSITLAPLTPSSTAYTINLPAENGTVCTTAAAGVCSTAGSGYVQLAPASVQADGTNNNSIFINKTSGTGNILELQKSNVDVFTVSNAGNLTDTGTITFGSTGGTLGYTNSNTGSTIAPANSTFSLYDGSTQQALKIWYQGTSYLVLQGPTGTSGTSTIATNSSSTASTPSITVKSGDQTGSGISSGSLTLQSGAAGGGTNANSGNVTLDSGSHSGSGTSGAVNIGNTNAPTILIGSGSGATTLANNTNVSSGKNLKVGTSSTQNSDQFVSVGAAGFDAQAVTPYGGFGPYSNLLKYSEQLGNAASWSVGSGLTVTNDATTAPDGQTTAENLNFTTTTSTNYDQQSYNTGSSVANRTFTFSFWAKSNTITAGQVLFRTAPTSAQDPTTTNFTLSSNWERYSFTKTYAAGDTDTSPQVLLRNNGVTGSYYAWGAQLEESSSAGAYISTTSSPISTQANGLIVGAAQSLFKVDTDSTGAFQVQNSGGVDIAAVDTTNGQLVLGQSGASGANGQIKFNYSGQTGSITLAPANPSSTGYTITLPAENGTVCTTSSSGTCNTAGGLSNVAYLNQTQTFTGTDTFAPTTNISSAIVKQTSVSSPTADIFDVQGTNGTSNFIQVTSTAANQGAVTVQSFGSNNLTLQAGSGTVSLGTSTTLNSSGSLTIASGGSSDLTLNSLSGTLKLGTNTTGILFTNSGPATIDATSGQNLNIGISNSAHTTTLGSTNASATTTIQGGNGITLSNNTAASANIDITGSIATKKGSDFSSTVGLNNVNFGNASLIRLTGTSTQTITGIANGRDGYQLTLVNAGTQAFVLSNLNGGSSSTNQITTGTGNDYSVGVGGSVQLVYDGSASLWRVVSPATGVTGVGTYSSSNNYANGASISGSTITLGSANATNPGLVDTSNQTFSGNKTFTGTLTVAPTTSIGSVVIKQTSAASPTNDIFDVQGTNGTSNFIQVTSTAANQGALTLQSFGSNDLTLNSGSATVKFGTSTTGLSFTNSSTATIQSTASQALNITGHATSSWTLDSGNLTIDTTGASASLNLGNGAQNKTIQIGNGGSTALTQTIDIGNNSSSSSATTIQIGNPSGTGSTQIQSGSGGLLLGNGGSTGNITIGSTGSSNSQTILIGNNTSGSDTVTVGAVSGSSTTNIYSGSGGVFIGNNGSTGSVQIGSSNAAVSQSLFIGNNSNSSSTTTLTVGSTQNGSALTLQGGNGTGAISLLTGNNGTTAGSIQIGNTAGAFTQTVNIATNSAAANTVNIGTGTSQQSVTIGNATNANSSVAINAGSTGGINLNANTALSANSNFTYASGTGGFDAHNASGTFQTSTGNNSLNGATTVTGTNTFTVNGGKTTLNGATAGSATAAQVNTNAASNVGLVIQGASSQSAALLQLQDSTGASVLTNDVAGDQEQLGYLNTPYGGIGQYGNLITYSEQFDNAAWAKTNSNSTANQVQGPDNSGSNTADQIHDTSSGGKLVNASATAASNNNFTFSVWLRTGTGNQNVDLRIDGSTSGTGTAKTVAVTNTWQRFSVTQNANSFTGNVEAVIFPGTASGSDTQTVYAWGGQLVLGSTAGVYSRTTGSAIAQASGILDNNSAIFQALTNSATAYQFLNSSAQNVATVDTNNGQLVLGTASTGGVTGKIKFFNNTSGSTGNITLQAADPTTNAYTITLPAETGTICTTAASAACTAVYAPAGGGYVNFAPSTVQADATNNNSIYINKTSGTGNILELQKSASDVFKVDNTGNVTSTGQNTLSRNGVGSSDYTFGVTGTPTATGTSSLVRVGGALTGGNGSANGGTYLSIVEPSSGSGSAADFFNLQNGSTVEMQLTAGGNLTVNGTYNTNTFNNNTLGFGGNSAVTISSSGSNNITLDTGSAGGTLALGNNAAATNLGTSNAAHTIGIGTGGGGTTTQAVTIGAATNSSSTLTLQGGNGSGAISLLTGNNGTTAGSIQIGNTSGAFNQTISIGNNNAAANTVQIGVGTGQDSVTVGDSTNANSSVTLKAGSTGGINLNANTTLSANSNFTYASGTGGFDAHNASGTFQTSTGNNSLNGATTVTGTNTFTVNGGATTLKGATAGSGVAATVNTNAASNVGLVIQGVASQSAALLQLQDSTGANVLTDDVSGNQEQLGYLNTPYGGIGSYGNLITYSEQFDNAAWVKTNSNSTANQVQGPDNSGTNTADQIHDTSSGGKLVNASATAVSNNSFTFSVWLRSSTGNQNVDLRIDGSTSGTGTAKTVGITTSWQRFSVTQNTNGFGGNVAAVIFPGTASGSDTQTVYAWGGQLVLGSAPGVYSRTASSAIAQTSGFVDDNTALFQNLSNSATAYQFLNNSAQNVATIDTSNGQLVLGTASTGGITGKIKLFNNTSGSSGSITLQAADPTTNSYTITLPAETGTICTTAASAACTAVYAAAGTGYVNFAPSTVQADATNNNSIFINKTSGTGNIFDLQKSASDVFKIDNSGNVTSTGQNTLSRNGAGTSDYTLGVTGTTSATGTSSLVRIGNALTGGNGLTNGGTYLSIVEPSSGAGSAADFFNLQNGSTVEMQLTAGGNLTVNGTYDTNTFNNNTLGFGGNSAATINSNGGNNLTIDTGTAGSGTLALGNNATATNLGTTNQAHTIGIGTGGGGTTTQAITIGAATNSSSTLTLQGGNGTGAISLLTGNNGTTAGSIQIGNTSGAFNQTISIGNNNAAANTVTIGTGTGQDSVTVGDSTNANSSVTLKAGSTGGISLNGNTTLSANSNLTYASGTGGFDAHNASGTFQTSTGNNSLNGATTVTGTNTFTVNGGATTLKGATAGSGVAATVNTNAASNVGLVVQGASSQAAALLQLQDSTAASVLTSDVSGDQEQLGYLDTPYGGLGNYSNLITYSEQFDNAAWAKTNSNSTANQVQGPDNSGSNTADQIHDTSSGGKLVNASATAVSNNNFTFSVWLRTGANIQNIDLRIDGSTSGTGTAKTVTATTTWQRFYVTQNTNGFTGNVAAVIFPGTASGSDSQPVYAWGAQLVQGGAPQVYIRTVGGTVAASDGLINNGNAIFKPSSDSSTAFQFQNAAGANVATVDTTNGQVVLGTAGSSGVTGQIKFNFTGQTGSITLAPLTPSSTAYTINLPAENGTVCTTAATGVCSTAGSGYVQLAPASVQADGTNNNSIFINKTSGTGNILELQKSGTDVVKIDNTGNITAAQQGTFSRSGSGAGDYTFGVTGSTSASATSSLVRIGGSITGGNSAANGGTYLSVVEPASGGGSAADFVNLQNGTTSELSVTSGGNIAVHGTYNGNTFTSSALQFSNASAASLQPAASQALTITGHATSVWSLDAGNLTLQTSAAASSVTIDAGTSGNGTITVGTNANSISLGTGTINQTISIGSSSGNENVSIANSTGTNTIAIGTSASATNTISIGTGNNSSTTTISAGTGGIKLTPNGSSNSGVLVKPTNNSTAAFQVQPAASSTAVFSVDTTNSVVTIASGVSNFSGLKFTNLTSANSGGSQYTGILGLDTSGNIGLSQASVSLTSPALAYWDGLHDPTTGNQSYPLATVSGTGTGSVGSCTGTWAPAYGANGEELTPACNNTSGSINWTFSQVPFEETQFQFKAGGGTGADSTWFYSYADGTPTTEYGTGFTKGYLIYFSEYHGCVGVAYGGYTDGNQCSSGGGTSPLTSAHISNIGDNNFHDVDIELLDNQIIVRWDGIIVLSYTDSYGRDLTNLDFGFGSRTGGSNNAHYIRGLLVTKLGTNTSQYNINGTSPLANGLTWDNNTNQGVPNSGGVTAGFLGINAVSPVADLEVDGTGSGVDTAQFNGFDYATGTVCQMTSNTCSSAGTPPTATASTNVWGTGTTFTSAMVGDKITFANGVTDTVASYVSATNITVSGSRVVFSGPYRLNKPNTLVVGPGGAVSVGGTLAVTGASTLSGTLEVDNTGLIKTTNASAFTVTNATSTQFFGVNTSTGAVAVGSTGSSTAASTIDIADTSNATGTQAVTIGSSAKAANSLTLEAGTGTTALFNGATAHTIQFATGAAIQTLTIGSTNSTSDITLQGGAITTTNNQGGVDIGGGFSSSDTVLTPFTLDSTSTLSETANTCTSSVNNGTLYYNSNAGSNSIRACINGGWEDLVSTAGAFFAFFGVVPDSGTTPGDIQGLSTSGVSGPCRVSYASTTTVAVAPCIAYSGGRKVNVAQTTVTLNTMANGNFQHICLTGTNNQPASSTGSATETANLGTVSFPSATGPIVCLADVKDSGATGISAIYDTRVYTTTTKEFGYSAAALPLGVMVKPDATNANRLALPGTTATGQIRGVVVASNGAAWSSGGPNVIIATAGLVGIKATAGSPSQTNTVQNSTTTSGYALTAAASTTLYANLGVAETSFSTCSASAASCTEGIVTVLDIK